MNYTGSKSLIIPPSQQLHQLILYTRIVKCHKRHQKHAQQSGFLWRRRSGLFSRGFFYFRIHVIHTIHGRCGLAVVVDWRANDNRPSNNQLRESKSVARNHHSNNEIINTTMRAVAAWRRGLKDIHDEEEEGKVSMVALHRGGRVGV